MGDAQRKCCPPQPTGTAAAASLSLSSSENPFSLCDDYALVDWKKTNVPSPVCLQQGPDNWVSALLSLPAEMPGSRIVSFTGKNACSHTANYTAGSNSCCTVWIPGQKSPPYRCSIAFLDASSRGNSGNTPDALQQQQQGWLQSKPKCALRGHCRDSKIRFFRRLLGLVGTAGMRLVCPPLQLPVLELLLLIISHQHLSSRNATAAVSRGEGEGEGGGGRRTFLRLPVNLALATVGPFCGSLLRRGLTGILFLLQMKLKENAWECQNRSRDATDTCSGSVDVIRDNERHSDAPDQHTAVKFCSAVAEPFEGEVLAVVVQRTHLVENCLVDSRRQSDAPEKQSAIAVSSPAAVREAKDMVVVVVRGNFFAQNGCTDGRPVVGIVTGDRKQGSYPGFLDILSRSVIRLQPSALTVFVDHLPEDGEGRDQEGDHAVQEAVQGSSFAHSLNEFLAAQEWGTEKGRTVSRATLLTQLPSPDQRQDRSTTVVEGSCWASESASEDSDQEMDAPVMPGAERLADGEDRHPADSWQPTSHLTWRGDWELYPDLTGDDLTMEGQARNPDLEKGPDQERENGFVDEDQGRGNSLSDPESIGNVNRIPSSLEFTGGLFGEDSISDQSGLTSDNSVLQSELSLEGGSEASTGELGHDSKFGGGGLAVEPDCQSRDAERGLSIAVGKESCEEDGDVGGTQLGHGPTAGESGRAWGGLDGSDRSQVLIGEPDATLDCSPLARTRSDASLAAPQLGSEGAPDGHSRHPFADHPTCVAHRESRHSHGDQTYLDLSDLLRPPWNHLIFWHGRCKEGKPTLCVLLGKAVRELPSQDLKHFIAFTISHIEYAELHFYDGLVKQVNLLMDLEGLGFMRLPPMNILSSIGAILNRDYAGRGGWIILVNAPVMLGFVISAIQGIILRPSYNKGAVVDSSFRGFLEGKERIMMLGSKYKTVLQNHFEDSMLPVVLGGACPCCGSHEGTCPRLGIEFLRSPTNSSLDA